MRLIVQHLAIVIFAFLISGCSGEKTGDNNSSEVRFAISTNAPGPGHISYDAVPRKLGLWEEEGLSVKVMRTGGGAQTAQLILSGRVQFGNPGPVVGLWRPMGENADLVSVYNLFTRVFHPVAVPESSSITSIAELKGKKIGVPNLASSVVPVLKAMIRDAGLDPEKDVTIIATGGVAPASSVLFNSKTIDALNYPDTAYATLADISPDYRVRPLPSPVIDNMPFGSSIVTTQEFLRENEDAVVAFGRGLAKGIIFAKENPEAAVRMHWDLYPEQKPSGVDEKTALEQTKRIMLARLENLDIEGLDPPVTEWGYHEPAKVKQTYDRLLEAGEITNPIDVEKSYTNDLINKINDFDHETWVQFAREYKYVE